MSSYNPHAYMLGTRNTTKVVKVQKDREGETVGNYDVYIGPKVQNSNWDFPKASKWCLPTAFNNHKQYKLDVLRNSALMKDLESLRHKRLGCWHEPPSKCHGQQLIELLDDHYSCSAHTESLKGIPLKFHYFRGYNNPLSNIYSHMFEVDGNYFDTIQQYVAYRRALFEGKRDLAQEFLESPSAQCSLARAIEEWSEEKNDLGVRRSLAICWKALRAKYKQCRPFRKVCEDHPLCVYVENTANKFWGRGPWSAGDDGTLPMDFVEVNGLNLFGYLILKTHLYYGSGGDYKPLFDLYDRLPEGPAKVGLSMVLNMGRKSRK